mgnify:CR=1 FL=1
MITHVVGAFLSLLLSLVASLFNVFADVFFRIFSLSGANTLAPLYKVFPITLNLNSCFTVIGMSVIFFVLLSDFSQILSFDTERLNDEHPLYLILKAIIFTILILYSKFIMSVIFDIGALPFQFVNQTAVNTLQNGENFSAALSSFQDNLGMWLKQTNLVNNYLEQEFTNFVLQIVQLVCAILLMSGICKICLITIERYIVLCIYSIIAPTMIAFGFSNRTKQFTRNWFNSVISQISVIFIGNLVLRTFIDGLTNVNKIYQGKNVSNLLIPTDVPGSEALATFMLLAWLLFGSKVEMIVKNLNFNTYSLDANNTYNAAKEGKNEINRVGKLFSNSYSTIKGRTTTAQTGPRKTQNTEAQAASSAGKAERAAGAAAKAGGAFAPAFIILSQLIKIGKKFAKTTKESMEGKTDEMPGNPTKAESNQNTNYKKQNFHKKNSNKTYKKNKS